MGWIKRFIKPRQNNFVRLLIQQAEYTVEGMEALEKYMKKRGEMLKLREIYRHLSNAADRGDEAANVITDIVVKMV